MRPLLLAGLLLALAMPASAQDLKVSKADGTSVTLSAETLADLPRAQVSVEGKAGPDLYEGPVLAHVMRAAGLPVGMRAHGAPMRGYLVVRGADGYAAVLSAVDVGWWWATTSSPGAAFARWWPSIIAWRSRAQARG
ncbi:MAG: hypothetical protein B7Z13_02830 [Caulobacterales bacterium 32-67-6]|nr:MAG: hypothetical protein B7Z13_02830 [Caulobacterales bacterium 32-67-6]